MDFYTFSTGISNIRAKYDNYAWQLQFDIFNVDCSSFFPDELPFEPKVVEIEFGRKFADFYDVGDVIGK